MHTYLLFQIISFALVVISSTCLIFQVPPSFSADDDDRQYLQCSQTFQCANLQHIGYPFWGPRRPRYCGFPGFNLSCSSDNAMISFKDQYYRVLSINQSETTLKVARADYGGGLCVRQLSNTTIHSSHLEYASDVQQLVLLYICTIENVPIMPRYYNCSISASTEDLINYILTKHGVMYGCGITVTLNVSQSAAANLEPNSSMESVTAALNDGFGLVWDANNSLCEQCRSSGGQCGYNYKSAHFTCYCKDGPNPSNICGGSSSPSPRPSPPSTGSSSPSPGSSSLSRDWIIGISVGISMTILLIVCSIYISRKRILVFFKKDEKDELDVEALIRNYGSITPKRYRYSNLQKMTNSFKDQIGRGGFGTVYKGKLSDDDDDDEEHLVAVKVLSESESSGEDFINEVASIGRSSHVNIVTLVGFCYERGKRALIYNYMPNGSLDKFIRKQGSSSAECSFDYWKTLSKIAVGIARGLEYLHRGCNTRILHFDIKPQNILLDKDFCPKISDFGLAKLCKTKESIVSHPGIRGTAGYMAPEVYSRNYGGVSHKSDVYSYGMLVLEMVGARRKLDSQVSESHTSKEFPHYIYKDLELLDSDENIYGATSEEEKEIAKKMVLISLGCIQTIPAERPSMHKVLEMLEGPLQSLPVPPKPLLISPARYVAQASVTSSKPSVSGQDNHL